MLGGGGQPVEIYYGRDITIRERERVMSETAHEREEGKGSQCGPE